MFLAYFARIAQHRRNARVTRVMARIAINVRGGITQSAHRRHHRKLIAAALALAAQ